MCSIEDLPYEILPEIFSNLSVRDILSSAQHVSRRWKEACHDIDTWRHKLYQPCTYNNDVIVEEVQRMPKLQGLLLDHRFRDDFFSAVTSKCRYLRTLIVTVCRVDHGMMETLRSNCLNIEQLQIPISTTGSNLTLGEVARLANLKTLVLTTFDCSYIFDVKPLADGCPSLERVSFGNLRILKEDLVYLLEKKGGTLRQLEVDCEVLGECVLPLLSQCKLLDFLDIECYCEDTEAQRKQLMDGDSFEMVVQQPLNLQNLQTVTSLSLKYYYKMSRCYLREDIPIMVIRLLRSHCLSMLVSLNLRLIAYHPKQLIHSVAENCPLLKRLHMFRCSFLTDTLMNVPSLALLEDVSLKYSNILTDDFIDYLSSCRSLQYLNLTGCDLGEGTMKKTVTLSNLKRLILDEGDVRGFPFHLVPDHMKNLIYISLYESRHVDWKGVRELKEMSPHVTIMQEPPIQYVFCSSMFGKFPFEDTDDDNDCAMQ